MFHIVLIVLNLFTISSCNFNLSILHFNDFHSRYEPIDNISTTCVKGNCIGGFSRLYSTIIRLKKENPQYMLLNAGDNFQGTLWYIVHKWNVTQHFLNKLPIEAMTLGNHEFDDGIAGLVPFLKTIQIPIIVSNIDSTLEPQLHNLYKKSVTIERQGRKIGVVGVLTTSTQFTSHTEKIHFRNESESVNSESEKLARQGTFTNIVLSHCGYESDLEIAKNSSNISIIVGGHTDTFLYSAPVPGPVKPSGPYPTVVPNKNGQKVLVVQASAYTKYLGNLSVTYDNFGNVIRWEGNPIFLGSELPTDEKIDAELALWKRAVDLEGNKIIGRTLVTMLDKPCRWEECPLGNFATDAMIFCHEKNNNTNRLIAIIHAGGMRAGIEAGNITFNQLVTTFPFQDSINQCHIQGTYLKEILESFIDDQHLNFPHLLQISGFRVVFNISKPQGQRVQSLQIRADSETEMFGDIDLEENYTILMPSFLTETNFNPLFRKYIKNKIIGDRDTDIYVKYLKAKTLLEQSVNGRTEIVQ